MRFFKLFLIKLVVFTFCFDFVYSQNPLNDPRLKEVLNQSGISVEDAKELLGKNTNSDFLEEKNIDIPGKTKTSDLVKEQVQAIREQDKSNEIENLNLDPIDIEKSSNTTNASLDQKTFFTEEALEAVKEKVSDDIISDIQLEKNIDLIEAQKDVYYGYKTFKVDPDVFQSSLDESIDPSYLIGPGDEIIIMLWGQTEINEKYTVSRDGYLFIENVGQVFVNSYTLEKLEKKLFKLLKKAYSSLDPQTGNPTTFFDVSLGSLSLKPLRVFVLGEVEKPGAYNMKTSATLFTSLYYFGGPKLSGSLRDIQLIRDEKIIAKIDFYEFLQTGLRKNDVSLQRDDVIFIPQRGKTVTTSGEIDRQMKFELKEGEKIKDLLKFAGGLKNTTYTKRIQINRILPQGQRKGINASRTIVDISLSDSAGSGFDSDLYDNDQIRFFSINNDEHNIVKINGHVERPGSYDLGNGLRLLDLIEKADSLKFNAYLDRADIVRNKITEIGKRLIEVNLKKALEGDLSHNIKLESNDVVTIYDYTRMSYFTNVSINGHVENPGVKEFYNGMDVYDLVFLGGGFENQKHLKNTFMEKAELTKKDENDKVKDIITFRLDSVLVGKGIANKKIERGDEIRIYSYSEVYDQDNIEVTVSGIVKRPGRYPITKETMLSEVLFRAGGFEDDEFKKEIFMERMDIIRQSKFNEQSYIISINLIDLFANIAEKDIRLEKNDKIRVFSNNMFSVDKKVIIDGSVNNPGEYILAENMTIVDLILEAGGFSGDKKSYRIDLASFEKSEHNFKRKIKTFTFELSSIKDEFIIDGIKQKQQQVFLKNKDEVVVRAHPMSDSFEYVTIEGEVLYPGKYVISSENEKVSSLVERAGGLGPNAYAVSSVFKRDGEEIKLSFDKIIKNPRTSSNFMLLDGDTLVIGKKSNLVKINGEVNTPGNYQYFKGKNLRDYIELAGGLSNAADRNKIYIEYPDGRSKQLKKLGFSPKVLDGSIIYVGIKEDLSPFNLTEYITNLTTFWTDLSQSYILLLLALRSA